MALKPEKVQEVVEKNTHANGQVDWGGVAFELNEILRQRSDDVQCTCLAEGTIREHDSGCPMRKN